MFDAAPIWVGGVYVESDIGSDLHGDDLYITFTGGAANTQLTRIIINTDQDTPGLSRGDNLFDSVEGGLGSDHAYAFKIERLVAKDPNARVTASVLDGSMQMVLTFENFYAGDLLVFSIDVDEVQIYDPTGPQDLNTINDGVDPITSGVEFQGSKLEAFFKAPNYEDIQGQSTYLNRYDAVIAPGNLQLPADDAGGLRDRTAGTAFTVTQIPKPISIAGTVFVDNNINLIRDPGDQPLEGVTMELFRKEGNQYVTTGFKTTTNAQGNYEFGLNLKLPPGTYQVRETQPSVYFSVGATPGVINGTTPTGQSVADNKDILTEIVIPLGDQRVTRLDFAEALPARIGGFIYVDTDDDGLREQGESGIAGVDVQLVGINTLFPVATQNFRTRADGSYEFTNLPPGTYRIVELSQPADYLDGKDTVGRVGGNGRGQYVLNDQLTEILLNGSDVGTEYNFGELPPSSLSGQVCLSLPGFDCFSTLPGSKEPIAGVKIELLNASGTLIATTQTDVDGKYRFDELPSGVYTIVETTPANVIDGGAKVGSINGQTNGVTAGSSRITSVTVGPGQDGVNYDFCEMMPASLSGHVFEDANDDGIRQSTELMIAGVRIELFDSDGIKVAEQLTGASGAYSFGFLRSGTYTIVESQPASYIDGKDQVGTILGATVGLADSASDTFSQIVLPAGRNGINYDFGELRTGSISGTVFIDPNKDGLPQPDEIKLPGIRVELIDRDGAVIQTTTTNQDGFYRFEGLPPGQYSVREVQPVDYFDGPEYVGTGGGIIRTNDTISTIPLFSGQSLVEYNFTEMPPAMISGYVFQDGETLVTTDGLPPPKLRPYRDGLKTADDTPIRGVTLELRRLSGEKVRSTAALPGTYTTEFIQVETDADGYFEFTGIQDGSYHVYQVQPEEYFDGLDTPGSTGGFSVNSEDEITDPSQQSMLDSLRADAATDPGNNAILRIDIRAGQVSLNNNFSEILVAVAPSQPPRPPAPPIPPQQPPFVPPPVNGNPTPPFERMLMAPPPGPEVLPLLVAGGVNAQYSWHLSIINAGMPRGSVVGKPLTRQRLVSSTEVLDAQTWTIDEANPSQWTFVSTEKNKMQSMRRKAFDVAGAIPLAGDFNGDGQDELALFLEGEWLIDINGNGRWDKGDMWAKLGTEEDLPVIGDWDGDGKDDIGIFGPEWASDNKALENEPGIPDPENQLTTKPKNLPTDELQAGIESDDGSVRKNIDVNADITTEVISDKERLLQRSILGPGRSDVIDHVFRFGIKEDQPVTGDFNGAGISTIGIFSGGKWRLDVNGDGRFTQDIDKQFEFGQPGDIAVVGDFDGDGIDEVAVIRGNQMIVDSNRNQQLDITDRVYELEGEGEGNHAIVGDFDGDGKDEAALMDRTTPNGHGLNAITREAKKAG